MLSKFFENWSRRREILAHARDYARLIKRICVEEVDRDCRVILFGSAARGDYRVDSDVDVLVVTEKAVDALSRAEVAAKIYERLGFRDPVELHVATPREFEEWYKRFIDVYEEF
ncbi:nucleotidyltransferase domain-containing protein [Thermofilum pendens]|uniref:DNA polymerase, beta domain protein region n=1 Tax=Thermofilum pendens (strain DSM 2475 / Hrk 5) TaxID=368408 RepID=A1S076_THEPD|nr:nucleotidyltransferase domain-containing protein [Thermofilum pendens]ABL78856.1 DNA polymerase, beta domain protein region [Thermofilum pendens Hrk 5]